MNNGTNKPQARLEHFDLLRAGAILYIIAIHHLDDYVGGVYQNSVDDILTYCCLGTFVFISGALLTKNNSIKRSKDILHFIAKRFFRIYPLYLFTLFLFFVTSQITAQQFIENIFFIGILSNNSILTLWFIGMICLYYLFYPLIIYRHSIRKSLSIAFFFFLLFFYLHHTYDLLDIRLAIYFPLFLLGIFTSSSKRVGEALQNKKSIILSLVLALIISYCHITHISTPCLTGALVAIFFLPTILQLGTFAAKKIPAHVHKKIAYASFCMYLFHRFFFGAALRVYHPENTITLILYLTFLIVPLIFVCSFFFQKAYDIFCSRLYTSRST